MTAAGLILGGKATLLCQRVEDNAFHLNARAGLLPSVGHPRELPLRLP